MQDCEELKLTSLRKMSLESRLGRALEELWQAALTVSTLKYVAGLVSQDIHLISNSLGELEGGVRGDVFILIMF